MKKMKARNKILTLALSAMMMLSLTSVKEAEAATGVGYVRGTPPTIAARGDSTKVKYEFAVDEDNGPLTAVYVTFSWDPALMTFDQTTTTRDNMVLANVDVVGGTLDAYLDSGMRDEKCGVTLSFTNVLPEGTTEKEASIDIAFKGASIPSNPNGLEFSGDDWEYLNLEHIEFQQTGKIRLLENQTLTFDANSGAPTPTSITQLEGSSIDLNSITAPTKAGYRFDGWYSGVTKYEGTITMPKDGMILKAQWVASDQTITFDTDGGSLAPSNIIQATDTSVNLDLVAAPTKAGRQFEGWYVGSVKYSGTITMPVGGLNLVAHYNEITLTDNVGNDDGIIVIYRTGDTKEKTGTFPNGFPYTHDLKLKINGVPMTTEELEETTWTVEATGGFSESNAGTFSIEKGKVSVKKAGIVKATATYGDLSTSIYILVPGDVSRDELLNGQDSTRLQRYNASKKIEDLGVSDEFTPLLTDLNGDGLANGQDVSIIQRMFSNVIKPGN